MDAKERLVQKLIRRQVCPRCDSLYQPESLSVVAHSPDVWMVMVACATCSQAASFVVQFSKAGRRTLTIYRLSRPSQTTRSAESSSPVPLQVPSTPVTDNDVLEMRQFLEGFDGDFQRLFAEIE